MSNLPAIRASLSAIKNSKVIRFARRLLVPLSIPGWVLTVWQPVVAGRAGKILRFSLGLGLFPLSSG